MSLANADGTFYLVRHAEKQDDGTKDPHLTEQGQKRTEYLAQQLLPDVINLRLGSAKQWLS
ncbi:MAG: hypothetical protein JKX81_03935 [Arenicella sp.]|nr:hypothetical protein [Arenicella sp.]